MIDLIQHFWKPVDWTSFDVVRKLRSVTKVKKIGHAGTLDPFAQGVLVVCFGRATKRVSQLMDLEKEYLATVKLGLTTDTLDPTGTVTSRREVPALSPGLIEEALAAFVGPVMQVPPMYSALKVNGQRLYKLARAGKEIVRAPRQVVIQRIDLLEFRAPDELKLRVVCGKGTYIRTLAADIAQALDTVGHVAALSRTRVGPYDQSGAVKMEEVAAWTPIAA